MGQRLNLEITRKGKTIANAYYHWSAYTGSAYALTHQAVYYLETHKHLFKDDRLLAIRALEATGAGLPEYEDEVGDLTRIQNLAKYRNEKFQKCTSRNEGIIGCFKESIASTQQWSEGDVFIDLDDLSICFGVIFRYDTMDELKEYYDDLDPAEIVKLNYDVDNLSIHELGDLVAQLVDYSKIVDVGDGYITEIG